MFLMAESNSSTVTSSSGAASDHQAAGELAPLTDMIRAAQTGTAHNISWAVRLYERECEGAFGLE